MISLEVKPHDIAAAEIEGWRGRCLNIYSRGEHAVAAALAAGRAHDPTIHIQHLAGQRLTELQRTSAAPDGTRKQRKALETAIANWAACDEKRPYFSHGIVTALIDRAGSWHVQLDMTVWKGNTGQPMRLSWSKVEADDFEKQLTDCFSRLSGQLGQFRKRLG